MGFYIKDLYIHRVPKFTWHDPLTNPPTVPETSPVIQVAALSPRLEATRGGGGGGEVGLPADDNTVYTIPTWWTPVIQPAGRLEETDLRVVRDNLAATLKAVEGQIEKMQPTAEDLEHVSSVFGG